MHCSVSFLKCCETLSFIVRDVVHITPENFSSCVGAIRTFVEASYRYDPQFNLIITFSFVGVIQINQLEMSVFKGRFHQEVQSRRLPRTNKHLLEKRGQNQDMEGKISLP